jgi:hypothetical protein
MVWHSLVPHECQKNTYPKVKTSGAGNVKVRMRGTIWTPA